MQVDQQMQITDQIKQQKSIQQHNKDIFKQYFKQSKFSLLFLLIIWILFLIEYIKTPLQSKRIQAFPNISYQVLIDMGANVPLLVQYGEIYRLITATLLHVSMLHIMMNSISLLLFCSQVEAQVHYGKYLIVYIIGGTYGNLCGDFYNLNFGNNLVIAVGASTSICAIMGLYIGNLYMESKKRGTLQQAKKRIVSMLGSLIIISLLPGVDFFGHFGSLIAGLLIEFSVINQEDGQFTRLKWFSRVLLVIYTLLLLTIFV